MSMSRRTLERGLIVSAQAGDRAGFDELVNMYHDRLFRSMLYRVRCHTTCEDVVQDTFTKAFVHLNQFRLECNFYSWLYRIALNSRRRYQEYARRVQSVGVYHDVISPPSVREPAPSSRMESREAARMVRAAIERLPERHRVILKLREYDGYAYTAIAKILRIEVGTVRSRLSRARQRLKAELNDYMGEKPIRW